MATYKEFHQYSIEKPNEFWTEQAQLVDWNEPFTQVCDYSRPPFAKWFVGGKTNLCHNAVDRHAAKRPNDNALIFISTETDEETVYSFAELQREIERMAAIYQSLGVKKGDRVLIYMPMVAQACFAILAATRIGAIHSVVFGGFASGSLATRIDDAKPVLIVSSDAGMRGGKAVPYKHLLDEAIDLTTRLPVVMSTTLPNAPNSWMPRCRANGWSHQNLPTFFTPRGRPASRRACSATPAVMPWHWLPR